MPPRLRQIAIEGFNRGERLKETFAKMGKQLKPGQTILQSKNKQN